MTVICWDGKILAADKRSTVAGLITTVTKIWKLDKGPLTGCLIAGSGDLSKILAMKDWIERGAAENQLPPFQNSYDTYVPVMLIDLDGLIWKYEIFTFPFQLEVPFHAIGSGRDYAIATMALGFDAVKAVQIASEFDNGCGNGIDVLTL